MKEMLGNQAEGEIEFYQSVRPSFKKIVIKLQFYFRQWKSGNGLYLSSNVYGWMFKCLILMIYFSYTVLLFSRTSCKDFVRNVLLNTNFNVDYDHMCVN